MKGSRTWIWLLAFLPCFGLSVWLSHSTFARPMGAHLEGLTAHTLLSMRFFEDWGFFKAWGLSGYVPRSSEFSQAQLGFLPFYVSYPSGWLVLPYAVFKLAQVLGICAHPSVAFVDAYSLVFDRLGCCLALFLIFRELLGMTSPAVDRARREWLAFLGALIWLFSAPVLYWSQNIYFSDEGVLLPIYLIVYLLFSRRFRLTGSAGWIGFFLGALACSIDWYGWVVVGLGALVLAFEAYHEGESIWASLRKSASLLLSMVTVGVLFLIQLFILGDRLSNLVGSYQARSGANLDNGGQLNGPLSVFRGIVHHWPPYFKALFSIGRGANLITAALILGFLAIAFWRASRQAVGNRRCVVYAALLLVGAPLIQLLLVKQHSVVHEFSAFKIALFYPLAAVLLASPRFREGRSAGWTERASWLALSLLVLLQVKYSARHYSDFAGATSFDAQERGEVLRTAIMRLPPNTLLVSEDMPSSFYPVSLSVLWYTDSYVYLPMVLHELVDRGAISEKGHHLKFIALEGSESYNKRLAQCKKAPAATGLTFGGKAVVTCPISWSSYLGS